MYHPQTLPVSYCWKPVPLAAPTPVPFAAPTHVAFVAPYALKPMHVGTRTPPVVAKTQPVEKPSEIALDSSVPSAPSADKWTIAGAIAGDLLAMLGALVVFLASVCFWLRKMAEKKAEKAPVEAHAVAPGAHDVPEPVKGVLASKKLVEGVLASKKFGATGKYQRPTATPTSAQTVVPQQLTVRERVEAFQRLGGALAPVNTART